MASSLPCGAAGCEGAVGNPTRREQTVALSRSSSGEVRERRALLGDLVTSEWIGEKKSNQLVVYHQNGPNFRKVPSP